MSKRNNDLKVDVTQEVEEKIEALDSQEFENIAGGVGGERYIDGVTRKDPTKQDHENLGQTDASKGGKSRPFYGPGGIHKS